MEERCEKFLIDAKLLTKEEDMNLPYSPKLLKQISTLRRFLLKNQGHRFTDASQNNLFESIRCYYIKAKQIKSLPNLDQNLKEIGVAASYDVIKDGLAMPFTVFSTKHKKAMLRWHEELAAFQNTSGSSIEQAKSIEYQVLSIEDDGYLSLLDEAGNIVEDIKLEKKNPFLKQIRESINKNLVYVNILNSTVTDIKIQDD